MADNIGNLVDTNQFAEFYFDKLKEKLNLTDINLNRLGFVGFFIELLGNVQYDVKGYYDHLFNESFPISATDNTNLLYHSAVFGYTPELAKPAEIIGAFNINPILTNILGVTRRELVLKDISFVIDNIEFNLDSNYTIVYLPSPDSSYITMNVEILYKNTYDIVPVLYSNSHIKTVGLLQYTRTDIQFGTSNYPFGNHYIYDVPITDYLYELLIEIQLGTSEFTSFRPLPIKEFASDNDTVVFYNILPGNILRLYFGSGIKGMYVPGKTVNLIIKTTKAEKGNIGQNNITVIRGSVDIYDYDSDNKIINYPSSNNEGAISTNASSILSLNIINGLGGKNPSTDDILRQELLKYIQTRDNLVSDTDFHNNLKTYSKDSEILFKKTEIAENIIYLYGRILNKYSYPIYTLTESILKETFESELRIKDNKRYIINPTFNIYNKEFNCPFYFEYNSLFNTYDGYIYYESINYFPSEAPIAGSVEIPKDLFMNLFYNKSTDTTRISIKTNTKLFEKLYLLTLKCQVLNINLALTHGNMTVGTDTSSFFYDFPGIIAKPVTFEIILDVDNSGSFTHNDIAFIFNNVQNVFSQIQSLRLKFYTRSTIQYLMNVPLVYSDEYNRNKIYYTNTIKTMFDNMNLKENRMISDEVQFRFLNTYSLSNRFSTTLLKQAYDIDLVLPFKVSINVSFSKQEVIIQKLRVEEIINNLRFAVSKHIMETTTGLNLNFYRSKIADICHNFQGVKSVLIKLTDANNKPIPQSSIETVDKETFIDTTDKVTYLHYTPIFWWFDVNNIDITTTML
jgi:hypothetical protein